MQSKLLWQIIGARKYNVSKFGDQREDRIYRGYNRSVIKDAPRAKLAKEKFLKQSSRTSKDFQRADGTLLDLTKMPPFYLTSRKSL